MLFLQLKPHTKRKAKKQKQNIFTTYFVFGSVEFEKESAINCFKSTISSEILTLIKIFSLSFFPRVEKANKKRENIIPILVATDHSTQLLSCVIVSRFKPVIIDIQTQVNAKIKTDEIFYFVIVASNEEKIVQFLLNAEHQSKRLIDFF